MNIIHISVVHSVETEGFRQIAVMWGHLCSNIASNAVMLYITSIFQVKMRTGMVKFRLDSTDSEKDQTPEVAGVDI